MTHRSPLLNVFIVIGVDLRPNTGWWRLPRTKAANRTITWGRFRGALFSKLFSVAVVARQFFAARMQTLKTRTEKFATILLQFRGIHPGGFGEFLASYRSFLTRYTIRLTPTT